MVKAIVETAITLLVVITFCVVFVWSIRRFFPNLVTELPADGLLLTRHGAKPKYFTDETSANIFIAQCKFGGVTWDVFSVNRGELKFEGTTATLT